MPASRRPDILGAFLVCEVTMPAVTITPRQQIRDALMFVRDARHHSGCVCGMYRDREGEGFCSDREALWSRAINKLIDDCLA
jgi:hypothetical protein